MWLFLCEHNDLPAVWAYHGLRARGVDPLELVTAEQLAYSLRWEHRLDDDGVLTQISLADGRNISSSEIRGAVNRLQTVPARHLARASEADRAYAHQELTALILSFLHSLPEPTLNRPIGQAPSGPWLHLAEWTQYAVEVGLAVPTYARTSGDLGDAADAYAAPLLAGLPTETVIVVGNDVVGRPSVAAMVDGSRRLAERAGASLLGVQFALREGEWLFAGATPYPDLTLGGAPLLELLAATLTGERSS
jgi:hypothetical protein